MKPKIGQGDRGKTHLAFGSREKDKVAKDDARIEAAGILDELVARIGVLRTLSKAKRLDMLLEKIQDHLFRAQAHIAILPKQKKHPALPYVGKKLVDFLEKIIQEYEQDLPELRNFIYPGSTGIRLEAELHTARAQSRTAERRLVAANRKHKLNPHVVAYVNRLSDVFFILARWINHQANKKETKWIGRKKREV